MKKFIFTLFFLVVLTTTALADGDTPGGGGKCSTCLIQIEQTETNKTDNYSKNYFEEIIEFFKEIF